MGGKMRSVAAITQTPQAFASAATLIERATKSDRLMSSEVPSPPPKTGGEGTIRAPRSVHRHRMSLIRSTNVQHEGQRRETRSCGKDNSPPVHQPPAVP